MTDYSMKEVFELPNKLELISEEKVPSLYSLSSFTYSICSDSTIDLDELNQVDSIIHATDCHKDKESKPLKNNFMNEKLIEPDHDKRTIEVETPEPSIKPVKQAHPAFSKSVSLHDVSGILPLNLTAKSNTVSCETINSQSLSSTTKSKDSGFQRSLSCLSLTSGRKGFDHVQSKVKAYIKNIKESEALNKKNKLLQKQEKASVPIVLANDSEVVVEKDDLIKEIQELKHELHEKSLYIDAQQRNYNKLLLKFAEAKNIIDKLRVQSMSFNYNDGSNSKNQISSLSNINLDYKQEKNFGQLGSCKAEQDSTERDDFVSAETTNEIIQERFKPRNHSSPYEKSLSPVRKIFSSSFRLDKNYQPLANLKQSDPQFNQSQPKNNYKGLSCSGDASKNDCLKLNNQSNLLRRQSMTIDLPNDDPFDKVKKWQASLPSINLLGSYSSSEGEDVEHNFEHSPGHDHFKKSENDSPQCCFTRANESEICNILSQELQNKCIITEIEVDTEKHITSMKNNQDVTKPFNKGKKVYNQVTSNRTHEDEEKSHFINNQCSTSKHRHILHLKQPNKSHVLVDKPLNCIDRGNSIEVIRPSSEFEGKNIDFVPFCARESSVSEGGSTHLPKSSSISNIRINKVKINDDISDDSSSISSSVFGSNAPPSIGSPKRSKRRLVHCEGRMSNNKVPKITKSKSSQTTFILREPKFNFTPPFDSSRSQINNQISKNKISNYETRFKHRSLCNPNNNSLNTESSQKKAWNARNNANFYVCKDFSFTTESTSLMECIKDMEGLVSKGSLVIRSVVDRNNSSC